MRKILISAVAASAMAVVPALAAKPATAPTHPTHPPKGMCKAKHLVGFNAKGILVSSNLVQDEGATTYSGPITVNVTKANHKAPTGEQTFTLTNAKVSFYNDTNGQPVTTPAVNDIVHLHGKVGHVPKKCPGPVTIVTSVTRVSFTQAPPAPTAPTS